mmetsp:Transcript_28356/g.74813  ORF Transcript_28356/g.74813 Transcript_28356/m.74813 type:complete len:280 (-) Transcript_28356:1062-1901(-)
MARRCRGANQRRCRARLLCRSSHQPTLACTVLQELLHILLRRIVRIVNWWYHASAAELSEYIDVVVYPFQLIRGSLQRPRHLLVEHPQVCFLFVGPFITGRFSGTSKLVQYMSKVVKHGHRTYSIGSKHLDAPLLHFKKLAAFLQCSQILRTDLPLSRNHDLIGTGLSRRQRRRCSCGWLNWQCHGWHKRRNVNRRRTGQGPTRLTGRTVTVAGYRRSCRAHAVLEAHRQVFRGRAHGDNGSAAVAEAQWWHRWRRVLGRWTTIWNHRARLAHPEVQLR